MRYRLSGSISLMARAASQCEEHFLFVEKQNKNRASSTDECISKLCVYLCVCKHIVFCLKVIFISLIFLVSCNQTLLVCSVPIIYHPPKGSVCFLTYYELTSYFFFLFLWVFSLACWYLIPLNLLVLTSPSLVSICQWLFRFRCRFLIFTFPIFSFSLTLRLSLP